MENNHNQEIEKITADTSVIMQKMNEIVLIEDPQQEARAVEFLKQIKMRLKVCDDARTRLVKPLNDHVKMINAEFKTTTDPLNEADQRVRGAITAFRNSLAFKQAEADRKKLEDDARDAIAAGDVGKLQDVNDAHAVASELAPVRVQTQSGRASFRKVWRYAIENETIIPDEYWKVDEAFISLSIKSGQSIPGVRAWQEDVTIII